jgi:hypothetical protein
VLDDERIRPGMEMENGDIKSFNCWLRDECLTVNSLSNLDQARE